MSPRDLQPRARHSREAGLSLVELLVAVALGAILMAGAVTLFVNNRATYEVTNDMARLQENARFALEVMTQDIRMAGHTGCVNTVGSINNTLVSETGYVVGQLSDFGSTPARAGSNAVEGFEDGTTAWLPSSNVGAGQAVLAGGTGFNAVAADSDGITVRFVSGNRSAVDRLVPQPPPAAPLTVRDVNNEVLNQSSDLAVPGADASPANRALIVRDLTYTLNDDQAVLISDCGGGDLFLMNGAASEDTGPAFVPTGNATDVVNATTLSRSYSSDNRAVVAPLEGVRYFVRNNAVGVPALFRSRLDPNNAFNEITEELVDGVQSLQVLYGFDGPDADRVAEAFLRANQTTTLDTRTVGLGGTDDAAGRHDGIAGLVSVKIGLLMVTPDEMRKDGNPLEIYDVLDERFCNATAAAGGNGCTVTYPDDGRRRRAFTTTIGVRNFQ